MTRVRRSVWRRALLATAVFVALAAAPAAAPAAPYRVPSRDPVPRNGIDSVAGASSLRVADASEEGERTNGRIFGVDPREGPYSCSGTALNTPSHSIVLTAGHCVVDNGSWGRELVFIPAYNHGERPFGTFAAKAVFVTPQWRRWENSDFDVAALLVEPNEFGALTDVVGGRGYETGRSRFTPFQIFGYPAGALGGEELRDCETHGLGGDPLSNRFSGPADGPEHLRHGRRLQRRGLDRRWRIRRRRHQLRLHPQLHPPLLALFRSGDREFPSPSALKWRRWGEAPPGKSAPRPVALQTAADTSALPSPGLRPWGVEAPRPSGDGTSPLKTFVWRGRT